MASFRQAAEQAAHGTHVMGWALDRAQRDELLGRIGPRYPRVVADHVTLQAGVARDAALPDEREATIVGQSDDGAGVQALVVGIAGSTRRPDGSVFHITWSLGEGRRPEESNDVIAAHGRQPFDPPVTVRLEPRIFP